MKFCSIISLLIWLGLLGGGCYYVIQKMISREEGLKFFEAGFDANAIIAFGFFANGVICFSFISTGFFTVSLIGVGLIFVVGQVGGGCGFGIFQVGFSLYVIFCQLAIGFWKVLYAQVGLSLAAPGFR